jgi:hypothetical protein
MRADYSFLSPFPKQTSSSLLFRIVCVEVLVTMSQLSLKTGFESILYDWTSRLTAESGPKWWTTSEYYWPSVVKKLYRSLPNANHLLIAVLGCQGVARALGLT